MITGASINPATTKKDHAGEQRVKAATTCRPSCAAGLRAHPPSSIEAFQERVRPGKASTSGRSPSRA